MAKHDTRRGLIEYKRGDIRPNLARLSRFLEENENIVRQIMKV